MSEELILQENKQPRSRRFLILFLIADVIIALDQWTKWLVIKYIPLNTSWLPESLERFSPYARLLHIKNTGASFGMFQNGNIIFIPLTILIVGGIIYYVSTLEHSNDWMWVAAGLYLGGAVGNLIDRLTIGAVTDFISVGSFYIFNIADASINVSVAMLILLWIIEHRNSQSEPPVGPEESHE
ncbi:MAG: signal peptidase II [Anaerolineales bacterium]|nr:signal peptidase II [Anaerolineales bacterium]